MPKAPPPKIRGRRPKIAITWADIVSGRAHLRIPPAGKLLLLHWAGAPWSHKNPDATLSHVQIQMLFRKERELIVHGGSGLGKSVMGGCCGILEAMLPHTNLAVVAQRYDHCGHEWKYLDRGLRALCPNPASFVRRVFKNQSSYHEFTYTTIWGAVGNGFSVESDEGAALMGHEFTRVICGEGSHISTFILENRISRAIDRALMHGAQQGRRETGRLNIFTTPKGYSGMSAYEWSRVMKTTKNCPELLHYGSVDYAQTVWIREAGVLENPDYDRSAYDSAVARLSREAVDEQYHGMMVFRTGRVLKNFNEHTDPVAVPDPETIREMRLGVGIDTGAYTALELFGIDRTGNLWGLGSVYTEQETIRTTLRDYFVDFLVEALGPAFRTSDFTELVKKVDIWGVDPSSQSKLEIMEWFDEKCGVPIVTLSTGYGLSGGRLHLLPSLEAVDDWFRSKKLKLTMRADTLIDQISRYIWKTVRAGQRGAAAGPAIKEPTKEYDHNIDAMRFVIFQLDAIGPLEEEVAPIDFAEAWANEQKAMAGGELRRMMNEAAEDRGESALWDGFGRDDDGW